jgi:hypothetical protein
MIIATVTKQKFTIFKDFQLTYGILGGILAFPLNRCLDINLNDKNLCKILIGVNFFIYCHYIFNTIH